MRLNDFPNSHYHQDENVNVLNEKRIKLEHGFQMKKNFITNILKQDVNPVVDLIDQILPNMDMNERQLHVVAENGLQIPVFCAVILIVSKKVVVIKSTWIKDFNIAHSYNKGLKTSNKQIVFYSSDIDHEPDFTKSIAARFDKKLPAIYVANIYKFFREYLNMEHL